ncbi:MAG: glycoside hydrolase family 5 protein [Turicibacter sp.]|nr:glycoside hydrolase family 5 protein [Turicibacter sp.]
MKKLFACLASLALLLPVVALANPTSSEPEFADAHEIVDYITAGWNLGNTLDAHPHGFTGAYTVDPADWTPHHQETVWGNPITSRENILAIRDVGFNAIRIPITFYTFIDEDFNIRQDWMDRIVQVVDYAYDAGMIVIINTHHDERWIGLGLTDADGNLVPQYSHDPNRATLVTVEDSIDFMTAIWTQLSDVFANYGQRLIFEGLNEPRTIGSPAEWGGGTPVERENLNLLNQLFVDTVRGHGEGYNGSRFLMVPTYAAAVGVAAFDGWRMPTDPAGPNNIIVSLHAYTPWRFALDASTDEFREWSLEGTGDQDGPGPVTWALNLSRNTFPDYPIIIGEMGALNRDNLDSRVAWLSFYHSLARELDMRIFWWDNGQFGSQQVNGPDQFAIFDRRTNTFPFPELVRALTGYLPVNSGVPGVFIPPIPPMPGPDGRPQIPGPIMPPVLPIPPIPGPDGPVIPPLPPLPVPGIPDLPPIPERPPLPERPPIFSRIIERLR